MFALCPRLPIRSPLDCAHPTTAPVHLSGWLYALMALIVCLGATATAHSATQAKATFAVLLADWLLTLAAHDLRLLWPHPAHAPILLWATRYALLSPRRRRAALAFWLAVFGLVNSRVISRYECLALITATVALCTARRVYLAILTLVANHKPSLVLPLLARLVGSLNTSRALSAAHSSADSVGSFPDLSTGRLCASGCQARELVGPALVLLDRPSPALAARRREALARLDQRWLVRWPRATELAAALCGAERVAMPHDCEQVTPQRGKAQTSDADPVAAGSGSAWEMVSEVESGSGSEGMLPRCGVNSVAGGVAPEPAIGVGEAGGASVASDDASHNASVLCAISRKAQARFHVSGSEALNTAVLLARLNTGRPMLLVFGGNAHGWTDGVAQVCDAPLKHGTRGCGKGWRVQSCASNAERHPRHSHLLLVLSVPWDPALIYSRAHRRRVNGEPRAKAQLRFPAAFTASPSPPTPVLGRGSAGGPCSRRGTIRMRRHHRARHELLDPPSHHHSSRRDRRRGSQPAPRGAARRSGARRRRRHFGASAQRHGRILRVWRVAAPAPRHLHCLTRPAHFR